MPPMPAAAGAYGTALILILAFTTRFLPIGYVNASAALRSSIPRWRRPCAVRAAAADRAARVVGRLEAQACSAPGC